MPSQAPFFLDAPTLEQATGAYLNNGLTIKAPDGLYSDGTIIRRLVDGKFITIEEIPPCNPPCSPPKLMTTKDNPGVYDMSIHTGTTGAAIGAIVIKFTLEPDIDSNVIVGMEAEINGIEYYNVVNEYNGPVPYYTSPTVVRWIRYHTTPDCFDPGSNTFTGDIYDWNGSEFIDSGFDLSYTGDSQDLSDYTDPIGAFFMVVPKTSPLPEMLNIRAYVPCYDGTIKIDASCPALLPSIPSSIMVVDPTLDHTAYCALPLDESIYYVKTTNDYPGLIEVNTIVFKDQFGQVPLDDGYYKIPLFLTPGGLSDTIQIVDGVVGSLYLQC